MPPWRGPVTVREVLRDALPSLVPGNMHAVGWHVVDPRTGDVISTVPGDVPGLVSRGNVMMMHVRESVDMVGRVTTYPASVTKTEHSGLYRVVAKRRPTPETLSDGTADEPVCATVMQAADIVQILEKN